jgi:hypothetical protein
MLRSALLKPGATRVMRASGAFYTAFATRMSCTRSAHHVYNICVGCARDAAPAACDTRVGCALLTRLSRVCRPFMYCRCPALLARIKCAGWVSFGQYCNSQRRYPIGEKMVASLIIESLFVPPPTPHSTLAMISYHFVHTWREIYNRNRST